MFFNGNLDTSFADLQVSGAIYALAVQPDGKILVGGSFSTIGGQNRLNLARLNADGTVDSTFNPNTSDINGRVSALALQPDGKVVIGG